MTPMLRQYNEIKAKHPDALLLFRLGDFYEAFNDDAKVLSKVLGITLTGRGKGDSRIPMAGIPYHSIDNYLHKLVTAGYKVAMAEQLTKPGGAGTIVERGVVKIHTPGTYTDEKNLSEKSNHYISSIHVHDYKGEKTFYLSLLDLSVGDFFVEEFSSFKNLHNNLLKYSPAEVLMSDKYKDLDFGLTDFNVEYRLSDDYDVERGYEILTRHFNTKNLKGFGFEETDIEIVPLSVLLRYAIENQKTDLEHVAKIQRKSSSDVMNLDYSTIMNLELLSNIRSDKASISLFDILDDCKTSMGKRLLRNWIITPLINYEKIQSRLDAVDYFYNNKDILANTRDFLTNILDIERLVSKIGTGSVNGRDFVGLKGSLGEVGGISTLLASNKIPLTPFSKGGTNMISEIIEKISSGKYENIVELLGNSINDECPVKFDKGGVIKSGYNSEIDDLREIQQSGENYLLELQTRERKRTGIESLKVKFNKVFGYYIEVTKANSSKVPDDYVRKQTLVNAERYITPELKEYEEKILSAEDKLITLEIETFREIIHEVTKYIDVIQDVAKSVALLDCFCNFASLAVERDYVKAKVAPSGELTPSPSLEREGNSRVSISIKASRHPVVELIRKHEYISNDIVLGDGELIILTGPNMSGKSTYIRQVALNVLMAQIGCFVPAESAEISVVDRIYTRVGASDSLATGESTFMVEMNETSNILNNATSNSLVILDEVGRGTSTYDGVAIAWSIVKYIHDNIGCNTLFATHYHELTKLEDQMDRIKNYHVHVDESGDDIVFTHEIKPGGMGKSYGIHVAEMAGVPKEVIDDAERILEGLENGDSEISNAEETRFIASNENEKKLQETSNKQISNEKKQNKNKTSSTSFLRRQESNDKNTNPKSKKKEEAKQLGLFKM